MVFGGSILGGACKIWGNPYLNSTAVLFDIIALNTLCEHIITCNTYINNSLHAILLFSVHIAITASGMK